jgi:hypothetical protein
MKNICSLIVVMILIATASYSYVPVKKIDSELSQAEKDFEIAKNMFNPWYGGPLLTGSGNVMPPGYVNIGPSVQLTDVYAAYDSDRKSHSVSDVINFNPVMQLGIGLIDRVDTTLTFQGYYVDTSGKSAWTYGDTSLKLSLALLKEGISIPAVKISVQEYFPTGKYNRLSHDAASVQGTGAGSYTTEFGIGVSKVVWWWLTHPMQFRLSLNYGVPAKVNVKSFNSYGGGHGCDGTVTPAQYFAGSFGYEFSCAQKIVLACDIAYEYYDEVKFSGINGTLADGTAASCTSPSSDALSLAPAIEFVFTPDIALVIGTWFTVYGRNASNFAAGIISFSYGF